MDRENEAFVAEMAAWREQHGLNPGSRGKLFARPRGDGADAAGARGGGATAAAGGARDGDAARDAEEASSGVGLDGAPKKPLKAYALWYAASKERFRGEHPDADSVALRHIMNAYWHDVPPAERAPFDEQAGVLQLEYEGRLRAHAASMGVAVPAALAPAAAASPPGADDADEDVEPLPSKPARPLAAFFRWRELNVQRVRDANPTMNHDQLRRRLMRLYHEDTPEQERERKAHEAAFTADKERYAAELTAWEAEVARRYPPQEPAVACGGATDIAALVRAGKAPPNPRSYPKAHSLWYAASKGRFAGENPGLSHVELRKVMQEAWPTVAAEEKAPFEAESKRLKAEYEAHFTLWDAARQRERVDGAGGSSREDEALTAAADAAAGGPDGVDRDAATAWALTAAASATRRGRAASKRGSYDAAHRRGAWQQDSKDDEDDAANGGIGFRSFSSWQV